jgi:hypothetical protein
VLRCAATLTSSKKCMRLWLRKIIWCLAAPNPQHPHKELPVLVLAFLSNDSLPNILLCIEELRHKVIF